MPEPASPSQSFLGQPLAKTFGPRAATVLGRGLGLETNADLLGYYPRRHDRRGELTDLKQITLGEEVTVMARITKATPRFSGSGRGSRTEVEVADDHGSKLLLTFFNLRYRERELRPGRLGLFFGKVTEFHGRRQLTQPEYELLDEDDDDDVDELARRQAGKLIPIYRSTKKLSTLKLAQCVAMLLDALTPADLPDPLPDSLRAEHDLVDLRTALEYMHRPQSLDQVETARERLKWDEALPLQIALARRRHAAEQLPATARARVTGRLLDAFDARLPFDLTAGQREVCDTVEADLARSHPMHRLLQGEVGSGKTVVALRAMLTVVDAGGQAALLAPTEVLAQQHHRSILDLLGPLARPGRLDGDPDGTKVALLTGSQTVPERRANLLDAASGAAGIVVGTHAVIQDSVQFADLGLVVVDEQHRFGVEQRDALRAKAEQPPHLLVMTATPIPRTVAMTVFGDLETSVLSELPKGRSPIATHVVPAVEKPAFLARTWARIREEAAAGHQAYIVCPRIGGPDDADALADSDGSTGSADWDERGAAAEAPADAGGGAESGAADGSGALFDASAAAPADVAADRRPPLSVAEMFEQLNYGELAGLRIGVLHGKLPPAEKDAVMTGFAAGEIDVLIATTVIEVGVNVPNATVMAILDADRFGVSQLHQLRGRVGRGAAVGLCLLVTEAPAGTPARERLDSVAATSDGFELARIDLEQRREGDVLGAAQSGSRSSLKLLSVIRDEDLLGQARQAAQDLIGRDPDLAGQPRLAELVDALSSSERAAYLHKT
ncbi:MAG TPA: ATP-dependent DNA helicase RecG [Actinocrinis sp.]|nr:ATP-dependent DNA helicase RecG [Actinocrinis sp.]